MPTTGQQLRVGTRAQELCKKTGGSSKIKCSGAIECLKEIFRCEMLVVKFLNVLIIE